MGHPDVSVCETTMMASLSLVGLVWDVSTATMSPSRIMGDMEEPFTCKHRVCSGLGHQLFWGSQHGDDDGIF